MASSVHRKFPLEHTAELIEDGLRSEQSDITRTSQLQHFLRRPIEHESTDVDIGIRCYPDH